MAINTNIQEDRNVVNITIAGIFDFDLHDEFRKAVGISRDYSHFKFVVDMGAVQDMDSSALGMLLLLRESVQGDPTRIELVKCQPDIKEMLLMANFDDMFTIK
ncbi:MAG: STAS domain-containing protein [Gammaproteobacteria bacterium]|nr:STAS domain-containing protein [Gammaproteobacteria bacterium]MDH5691923.1 STAS domain-containing protein [Gammaproteobacteria bacterium]